VTKKNINYFFAMIIDKTFIKHCLSKFHLQLFTNNENIIKNCLGLRHLPVLASLASSLENLLT